MSASPAVTGPASPPADLAPYDGEPGVAQARAGWQVFLRVSRQVWSLGLGRMVVARADGDERYLVDPQERLHRILRQARRGDPWVLRQATEREAARLSQAWSRGEVRLLCEHLQP